MEPSAKSPEFEYTIPSAHTPAEQEFDARSLAAVTLVRDSPSLATWTPSSHEPLLAALLFRAADTLESIVTLRQLGNDADAVALGRVLYEHVTTYCWLLGDGAPPERFNAWWKGDNRQDRVMLSEMAGLTRLDEFEKLVRESPIFDDQPAWNCVPGMPSMRGLSREVDARWLSEVMDVLRAVRFAPLANLYTVLFRPGSGFIHASGAFFYSNTHRSIDGQIAVVSPGKILDVVNYYRMLTTFCYGLAVTHRTWGWPDATILQEIQPDYTESDLF